MASQKQTQRLVFGMSLRPAAAALALALLLASTLDVSPTAQAQTFTVLHNFNVNDGAFPIAGLTMDRAGNLYGTTSFGGPGSGTVFKLTHRNSGWVLDPLYSFPGVEVANPQARVIFGPDGSLYGTTMFGGGGPCNNSAGCGTVFNLRPPAQACKTALCAWTETTPV